ncbi:MAG: hypothetical protein WBN09_01400 [Woeseiaceae bacterium]
MGLFAELKRRNVVRVGAAYVVLGWVIAQVAEFSLEAFGAPDWALKSVIVILLLGLPLVLFFAWAFELTPDGVKREADVDRSQSITSQTGRKLDRAIIGILLLAVAWFAWDKFIASPGDAAAPVAESQNETSDASALPAENATKEKSVAVLPFVAMSSGPDDEYFADGLTEEILNSLAQLPELLVTARTSAFSFKGQDVPVQEIAKALGVRHIVEGSVRRSGDRLRVTAQLIRADDGFHLWSENYDSTSTDAIAVQENIAEQIATAMNIVLDERRREAMRRSGLRDPEAFTLYQKAIELFEYAHGEVETVVGLREANALFEQVIEKVPEYYGVYWDHSDMYVHILNDDSIGYRAEGVTDEDVAGAFDAAIADYKAAARYAPTREIRELAEIDLAFVSGDWKNLGRKVKNALGVERCIQSTWEPIIATTMGFAEEFLKLAYHSLECDPRRSLSWLNTARAASRAGKHEEALKIAREGMEIAPGTWLATELVRSLIAAREYDEAALQIEEHIGDAFLRHFFRSMLAAHRGDAQLAKTLIEELDAMDETGHYMPMMAEAFSGQRESANRRAALIDQHAHGAQSLAQATLWCGCGAPWDIEHTPNFAATLEGSGLSWPPESVTQFPLKDW